MRIIGGKDYYDGGAAYGADPAVVFVRNQTPPLKAKDCPLRVPTLEMRFKQSRRVAGRWIAENSMEIDRGPDTFRMTPIVVYLAGRRHGGVRVRHVARDDRPGRPDSFAWSVERLEEFLGGCGRRLGTRRPAGWQYLRERGLSQREMAESHFEGRETPEELRWLVENRVAVAVCEVPFETGYTSLSRDVEWSLNRDDLKSVGFAQRVDVMTAWQELSMFLGSTAPGAGRPMVEITDQRVKRDKAGFDEWSFKRMKES